VPGDDPTAQPRAERSIADAFYAGLYADVLRRTIDAASLAISEVDAPFVVGALAFVGRIEEARVVVGSVKRGPREGAASVERLRALVACRFFLGVACARAGRHVEAERDFRENLRAAGAQRDPICRFYVAQGLACFRYFRGLMRQAARHVGRSLRHAIDARFQYGRLLATDMRGHALVQTGQVRAGLALLEQARDLARSLGLIGNMGAIDCALATYRARFGVVPLARAIEELDAFLARTSAEDSYSRGMMQAELAQQLALAGRSDEAWAKLDAIAAARIPDGQARAEVRFLLACSAVARLRYGDESARTYVNEARDAIAGLHDLAVEVDVLCAELVVADDEARTAIADRLRALHRATGISRAEVYAGLFDGGTRAAPAVRVAEFEEDRAGARLHGAYLLARSAGPSRAGDDPGLARLLRDGHLGLVPLVAGAPPEASIIEVSVDGFLLAERGNVRVIDEATAGAARLLREVAEGDGGGRRFLDKERLLSTVWGIGRYRPDRHDAIVHTAVSRLRALLGACGHWIESKNGGYRLAPHVAYRGLARVPAAVAAEPTSTPPRALLDRREAEDARDGEADARERALLSHLGERGACSTTEAASALKVSEMTAFRTIRSLLDRGLLTKSGRGRGTRYAAAAGDEGRRR
jgi:hypothetical protein